MALTSEINSNNLCKNQNSGIKNHDKEISSLNFLLNWTPKNYYLNIEELKVSKGYKVIEEIEMVQCQDESKANSIKEQLQIRDNLINVLCQYFAKVFSISQHSQIKLRELNKKAKELSKKIKVLKQTTSEKLEEQETANSDDNVPIPMDIEESPSKTEHPAEMITENVGVAVPETEIIGTNEICSHKNEHENKIVDNDINAENTTETSYLNWNTVDVKEEVKELATEITQKLGYAFIEELDMYYDHSSGYYYDHKTKLYYDDKTGTYFYFNYETENYEFYAQVNPAGSTSQDGEQVTNENEEHECLDGEEYMERGISLYNEDNPEVAPSLRLMVMNGNMKGNLHIVTVDGGKIGREGDLPVLIKDPSVSKVHAEITYRYMGPFDHHYYLQDLGSINGTFLRGERLSESKETSDIHEIGHGFEIKIGDVILGCHMHPGLLTCNECEPGLVTIDKKTKIKLVTSGVGSLLQKEKEKLNKIEQEKPNKIEQEKEELHKVLDSNANGQVPLTEQEKQRMVHKAFCLLYKNKDENCYARREQERRRQNKIIRKKFAINYFDSGPAPNNNSKYKDRATTRRVTVGSDNPYEKTEVATIHTNLTRKNKGFQLMEKMGWSEGQTLGITDSGLSEPIVPASQIGREGFGLKTHSSSVDVNERSNKNILQRMIKHSKIMNPSGSATTPQNSEKGTGIKPIQFAPSSDSINMT